MKRGGKFLAGAVCVALVACTGEKGKLEIRSTAVPPSAVAKPVPLRIAEARGQLALGNVALALESFRKASREDPASTDAFVGMAACYDRMGRYDLSRRNYEAALALAPADTQILAAFAASLEQQGLRQEALDVRREAAARAAPVIAPAVQPVAAPALAAVQPPPPAAPPPAAATAPVEAAAPLPAKPTLVAMAAPPPPAPQPLAEPRAAPAASAAPPPASAPLPVAPVRPAPEPVVAAKRPAVAPAPVQASAPPPVAMAAAPTPAAAPVAPAVGPSVTVKLPPPRPAAPAEARAEESAAPAPAARPAVPTPAAEPAAPAPAAPAPRPIDVTPPVQRNASLGPRLERLSRGEIALVTTAAPLWRPTLVERTDRSATVRFVPLRQASLQPVKVRLLNAARVNRLAARTRSWLKARGWQGMAIGNAPQARAHSLILYPRGKRLLAQRLSAQFGFAIAERASGSQVTVLLGRDAARIRALKPASA